MYARPKVNGSATTLGVSGMLWRGALIMYDRGTQSLWSQINGKAVAGPLKGQRLEEVPSRLTTWGEWRRRYPDTLVLAKPPLSRSLAFRVGKAVVMLVLRGSRNPDRRLPGKELVFGLERDDRFAAVPLRAVEAQRVLNTDALGGPVVVTSAAAYDRRVEGRTLTFDALDSLTMLDRETGSRWSIESGAAVDGAMRGTCLQRLSSKLVYWGVWARFHPKSEIGR